jgi:type IV pilus assembly protein PilY1
MCRKFQFAAWVVGLSIGVCAQSQAATTDLASAPLASTTSSVVRPNVLFTLDDSGSMAWDYLPDYAGQQTSGTSANHNHCKVSNTCGNGETPFQTNEYNGMAYNPRLTYQLPVNADLTNKPSQNSANTTGWTAVKIDGYGVVSTGTINMTTGYREVQYCDSTGTVCKKNGVDTNNPFLYRASISADNPPVYAYPGTLTTPAGIASTLQDGAMFQATTATSTIYNGMLDISTASYNPTLTGVTISGGASTTLSVASFSHSGSTVTVNYSAISPALATGDKVMVSGSSCSTGWTNNATAASITVTSSTQFTYTSSKNIWTNTTCTSFVVTKANQTVTVAYTGTTPTAPPLATGNTVVVSGTTCDTGYKSGGASLPITVVNATHFTYVSSAGSWSTPLKTSCAIVANEPAHTAVAPSISKSGTTVTVTLASAPTPALATGTLVTVGNGAGTCDAGYQATSASMTLMSSTQFTYSVGTAVTTPTNTTCNITQAVSTPPTSPGISLSGTTVTVYKTAHGLVTGDVIQVSNGTSGICSSGYVTSSTVVVTRVDSNTFTYSSPMGSVTTNSNCRIDKMTAGATVTYTSAGTTTSNAYYFVIIPTEYCDSMYLTNCQAASAPVTVAGVAYNYPAPVRYCNTDATAALPPGDAGAQTSVSGTLNCQAKYSPGTNFLSVRYGLFWRGDIVPTNPDGTTKSFGNESYSGTVTGTGWAGPLTYSSTVAVDRSSRTDCAAAPNCTYAEEMTNFSNWYAYYHTRMQMMKSAAGRAFSALDNRYRVGFVTINESTSRYLPIAMFDATQKTNWYAKFYAINPGNSTPLREAMADAGRYFAGKKPGILTDDPMEYSCQENFELITTDGYWNGTDSNVKEIDGVTTMRNYDNVDTGASQRRDGAYDGAISGATDTLADVAMYYYETDLRNTTYGNCTGVLGSDVCQDNVPMTANDLLAGLTGTQHMTTFSLGLSDGLLTFQSDYATALTGDVSKIKTGALGCGFSGAGTCNWPLPVANTQTALDDLWHAAINGRGSYYNARDPASLTLGLTSALAGINVRLAAAAASATSSPNITQTDKSIFSSTYRTTKWDGEVVAQYLDPATGAVVPAIVWSAQTQLDTLVIGDPSPSKPLRHIYTFDVAPASVSNIKNFQYANLTASEQAYFDNNCTFTLLTQCTAAKLSTAEIASGNSGLNLVDYLRGDRTLETPNISGFSVFRARDHFLGDTVNSKPSYVKFPKYSFTDVVTPTYGTFKTQQTSLPRQGVLYVGSNDGMLHAFNTDNGAEIWTYVPKIVMPTLYKLAEASYATLHQYYVDGSPETMDIYVDATTSASSGLAVGWHSILVGGLGLGGRGYYALDVTDPFNPAALWEICSSSALCPTDSSGIVHSDSDLGYSYGNPVIAKRSSDGKWVVLLTSGYDNGSIKPDMVTVETNNPGSGLGILFELDAATGAVLNKTTTGSGTTTSPSGLAKISPWIDSLTTDYTARYVYGGDLNGDVWRFDLGAVGSAGVPIVTKIATLIGPPCVSPCTPVSAAPAQSITTRPELGDPLNNVSNSLSGIGNPGVFVGTGRYLGTSDPTNTQIQSIYAIKDDLSKTGAAAYIGNPRSPSAGFGSFVQQYIYQPSTVSRTTSTSPVNWSANQGWFADFVVTNPLNNLPVVPSVSPGERMNIDPNLVTGTLVVITNVPDTNGACNIGGTSWIYSFDFLTGKATADSLGNSLAVGNVIIDTAGGFRSVTTMASGEKKVPPIKTPGTSATRRTSWRELLQQ